MTTIAGLLTPHALDRLLNDAIKRRQAAGSLLTIAGRIEEAGVQPMTMEEIDTEVESRPRRPPAVYERSLTQMSWCPANFDLGHLIEEMDQSQFPGNHSR
jgi:hypothetical protein